MSSRWKFVFDSRDGTLKDDETKKLVRQNAMLSFRRNERLQRIQKIQSTRKEHLHHSLELIRPLSRGLQDTKHTRLPLFTRVGTGTEIDPFLTTLLHTQYDADRLFSHCTVLYFCLKSKKLILIEVALNICPILHPLGNDLNQNPIYISLCCNALTDPLLLTSVLHHSSVHLDLKSQQTTSSRTLRYKGEFLRVLKTRLNSVTDASDDSTIGAVSLMAATGVSKTPPSADSYSRTECRVTEHLK